HSIPGLCTADGCLMIDLRRMNKVSVDPVARRATVQGGAVWAEGDGAPQPHGLAVTGGHVTHTGAGGPPHGGGNRPLAGNPGPTSDSLESAQIVTADGRVLRAAEGENEDLFWAIRGGGGNFGVATEFEFRLHPVGPTVLGGLAFWAPEKAPELMRHYRALTAD